MTVNQDFLDLSVMLTGFTEFQLLGTGQAALYFATVVDVVGEETMGELLYAFHHRVQEDAEDEVMLNKLLRTEILSDPKLGPIARNIIKLWYVGVWYQLPYAWRESFGVRDNDITFIPSPISYTEGLLWPAIGSHPAGAKAPGYGTWGGPPQIPDV